jgi:hypothetical protein
MSKKSQAVSDAGIVIYLHCSKCIEEGHPPDLAAGLTHGVEPKLRLWCERHSMRLIDFELLDPPYDLHCKCCGEQ